MNRVVLHTPSFAAIHAPLFGEGQWVKDHTTTTKHGDHFVVHGKQTFLRNSSRARSSI